MSLHAIEPTRPPGQRRVDGVGRPKFDFHTGRRASASAIINPWSSTLGLANRATTVLPIALPFSNPASQASPMVSSGSSSSSLLSSRGAVRGRVALPRRPRRGGAAAALHNRGGGGAQPWHGAASHTTAKSNAWRIAASDSLLLDTRSALQTMLCLRGPGALAGARCRDTRGKNRTS